MPRPRLRHSLPFFVLVAGVLFGCKVEPLQPQPAASAPLAGVGQPLVPVAASEPAAGWQQIDSAMELRSARFTINGQSGYLTMVRLDPASYTIRVKYDVANAGSLREWYEAIKPLAIINGGYFDQQGKATALVIFDGIRTGESYEGFGGMVVINAQGQFELRSLRQQPFDPNEILQQAMQSAPMLIQPGGVVSDLEADNDRSRRSVIARDIHGRILLIVSDTNTFTLPELANVLKNSDLELDAALNLDGGSSTGLYVKTDQANVQVDSFDKLPLVLVVQRQ